jgi:hypothetical protein
MVFVPDPVGMTRLTSSWEGDVGRFMNRRLRTLEFRAKNSVGVSNPSPTQLHPGGALRSSIHTVRKPVSVLGLEAKVGSNLPYAKWHHEGTGIYGGRGAYTIQSRRPGGKLRFWWPAPAGPNKIVYANKVKHPGSPPNPYLTRWLKEFIS